MEQIFFNTDACVEPVLNFDEVENNSQNQARKIFYRENNILQANIAPKFSRSIPKIIQMMQINQKQLIK